MSGVAVVAVSRQIRLCPTGQVLGKKVMSLYIGSECGATCRETKGCAQWTLEGQGMDCEPSSQRGGNQARLQGCKILDANPQFCKPESMKSSHPPIQRENPSGLFSPNDELLADFPQGFVADEGVFVEYICFIR